MRARQIGPQDSCVQCGESKAVVRRSQRSGGQDVLFCAIVDYWGETEIDWDRHRFVWTQKDADYQALEDAYWEKAAEAGGAPLGGKWANL